MKGGAEQGKVNGKDLHLCGIFLMSVLCFSESGKDKEGTDESHGRDSWAEQIQVCACVDVHSEVKYLKNKGIVKEKKSPFELSKACLPSPHFQANP